MAIAGGVATETVNGNGASTSTAETERQAGPARSLSNGALPHPWTVEDARALYNI
jgi:hypothetical protein